MEKIITGTNSSGNKCKVLEEMLDYYLERGFVPDKKQEKKAEADPEAEPKVEAKAEPTKKD